jgi:hypothetical protein
LLLQEEPLCRIELAAHDGELGTRVFSGTARDASRYCPVLRNARPWSASSCATVSLSASGACDAARCAANVENETAFSACSRFSVADFGEVQGQRRRAFLGTVAVLPFGRLRDLAGEADTACAAQPGEAYFPHERLRGALAAGPLVLLDHTRVRALLNLPSNAQTETLVGSPGARAWSGTQHEVTPAGPSGAPTEPVSRHVSLPQGNGDRRAEEVLGLREHHRLCGLA